eukprot:COSAG03_NODE_1389_length_4180_cov_8.803725_2_plen_417_part_00
MSSRERSRPRSRGAGGRAGEGSPGPGNDSRTKQAAPGAQSHDALTKQMADVADLRDELSRVKESHVRREARMQQEIAELKVQLQEATGGRIVPEKMEQIRDTHSQIQAKLGEVQGRTVELLRQQKDEMARQFHLKLAEVVDAKSKSNELEHSAEEWAARFREAQDHLKRTETHLIDSDRRNKLLETENKRLRSQYRSQENDREFLVRQLVAVKRDNSRLREELQKSNARGSGERPDSATGLPSRPGTADSYRSTGSHASHASYSSHASQAARPVSAGTSDTKLRETATRLKKLLDRERAQLRQVRAAYATDQQNRSELGKCQHGRATPPPTYETGPFLGAFKLCRLSSHCAPCLTSYYHACGRRAQRDSLHSVCKMYAKRLADGDRVSFRAGTVGRPPPRQQDLGIQSSTRVTGPK